MLLWNPFDFSMIQGMLAIWFLVPLPFLNPAWTSGSSQFMECWNLVWRILSITLLAWEMSTIVWWFEHFFSSVLLENWDGDWSFLVLCHCWIFQIVWHIECSTQIASSFRILNSSAGIPLPLLVLLTAVLPKAHLTSHSRMFDSG